ncbi:RNA-binding protein RO60-like [Clytia hemisphaerica]|uniref:TROVE domain-containing protein n=1 Tax=Clytia hemisphaerica TaxID=252671 RepID=A0A7M5ULU8_9CNID
MNGIGLCFWCLENPSKRREETPERRNMGENTNFLDHEEVRIADRLFSLSEDTSIQPVLVVTNGSFSLERRFKELSIHTPPKDVAARLLGEYEYYGINELKKFLRIGCKACPQFTECHKDKKKVESVAQKHQHECLRIVRNLLAIGKSAEIIDLVKEKTGCLLLHYEPLFTVLSLCSIIGEKPVRKQIYEIALEMCFNCPRLFYFVACSEHFRHLLDDVATSGKQDKRVKYWEPLRRRMIARFYNRYEPHELLYMTTRHKQRYKITHRTILCKSRPPPRGDHKEAIDLIFCYLSRGFNKTEAKANVKGKAIQPMTSSVFQKIELLEEIKSLSFNDENIGKLQRIIEENIKHETINEWQGYSQPSPTILFFNVLLEHIPNEFLRQYKILRSLLPGMPIGTLIFKLGVISHHGLFMENSGDTPATKEQVDENIQTALQIIKDQKNRLHPFKILKAAKCYSTGQADLRIYTRKIAERKSLRTSLTWKPSPQIIDALYEAFRTQQVVEGCVSERKILFAMDNRWTEMYKEQLQGCPSLTPIDAANILLYLLWKAQKDENEVVFYGKRGEIIKLKAFAENKLEHFEKDLREKSSKAGPINLIKTIEHAEKLKKFDAIVVLTDKKPRFATGGVINEWEKYKKILPDAKMVLVCLNECKCFGFGRDDMLYMCGWDENSFANIAHFLM